MANDDERTVQPTEIAIVNSFLGSLVEGEDEGGTIHVSKTQPDGTMRSWALQVGRDEDGVERIIRVDEEGRQENVLIVTDGDGNKLPIAGTEDGVLRVDLAGAVKREEITLMKDVLNELRLHRMFWMEMTENNFDLKDLGELEAKES